MIQKFIKISVIRCQDGAIKLQLNLNNIYKWCQEKNLYLNLNTFSTITIFKFEMGEGAIKFNYSPENNNLLKVTKVHDFEVKFHSKLYFNDHLNFIRNNVNFKSAFSSFKINTFI